MPPVLLQFYEASETWCQSALAFLRTRITEGLEIPQVSKLGFEVRSDRSFSSFRETKSDERTIEPLVNQKFYGQLLELPAFHQASEIMGKTEQIARHLDTQVGTQYGTSMIRARWVLTKLLINYWDESKTIEFEEAAFDRVYQRLETFLCSNTLRVDMTMPLDGFESDVGSIELGDGLLITRLTEEKIQEMYATNEWFRDLYKHNLLDVPRYAIMLRTEKEKIFGVNISDNEDLRETLHAVISVLRIYKAGSVWWQQIHVASGPAEWGCHPSSFLEPRRISNFKKYTVEDSEVPDLQKLWKEYISVDWQLHQFIRVAVDRLNFGIGRDRSHDKMIDYVVALEALLLSYLEDFAELRFRFALRGAKLLGKASENKRKIYSELKKIYDRRSKIVHGSSVDDKDQLTEEFIDMVEEYARLVLRRFIDLAKDHRKGRLIDWDSVVLD